MENLEDSRWKAQVNFTVCNRTRKDLRIYIKALKSFIRKHDDSGITEKELNKIIRKI